MSRHHGEGSIYQRKSDGRWISSLRYKDAATRKARRAYFTGRTRKEVAAKLEAAKRELVAQRPVIESRDTVRAAVETWFDVYAAAANKPTTVDSTRYLIGRRLLPYLGDVRLDELDEAVIVAWQRQLIGEGLSPATVQKARRTLAQVLDLAVESGQLRRNAVRSVPAPRAETSEAVWYSSEQVGRLLAAARGDRAEALLRFIAYTGVRKGEALALRWVDVQLELGRAQITGTLARTGGKLVRQSPKTAASRAAIDLHPQAVAALELAARAQELDRAASEHWSNAAGYVFTTASGEPIDPRNVLRSFDRVKRAAGIVEGHVHSLRHSFAAQLVESGTPIHAVSRHLHHSRVSVTMDVYGHLAETGIRDAVFAGFEGFGEVQGATVTPLRAVGE